MRRGPLRNETLHALLSHWRFLRFLAVGVINTIFGYGVYFALLRASVPPTLALAAATTMGVLFNFVTTGRFVFTSADGSRIIRFAAVYGVVFLVNATMLQAGVALGIDAALMQALLLAPCVFLSYLLNRTLVFNVSATKV